MKNIKLTIEYDGTNYFGWQKQPSVPTVQGEIEKAISKFLGRKTAINGASRTDAGVHALNQVANFKTDCAIDADALKTGLNRLLPRDIVIKNSCEAGKTFHARYSAKSKIYRYFILNENVPSAFGRYWRIEVSQPLNVGKMRKAGKYLEGRHDFASLMTGGSAVNSTKRTVSRVKVSKCGKFLVIEIQANGFLREMARLISGLLIRAGLGKITPEDVNKILKGRSRALAGKAAEPRGLFLYKVIY